VKRSVPSSPSPPALAYLDAALAELDEAGLLRRPRSTEASPLVFCSNDYLGLAAQPSLPAALGAGAARLVSGQQPEHEALEGALAAWLGTGSALAFSSGYAANVGALSALAGAGDLLLSDKLNHASIIDGARLSRAEIRVYPHLDVDAVRHALESHRATRPGGRVGRAWVVTESYFSMDADSPDLRALRSICDEAGAALFVDEAHAVGVFGPDGRGLCAAAGVVPDVLVGTLGKAFGASGAFVAGCEALVSWLWNRARSFVFSTGLSPAVAEGARRNLERSLRTPELRARALARAGELRTGLARLGIGALGHGVIVPCVVGDPGTAVRISTRLAEQGILAPAIRPPTVPEGTSRLRLTATAGHSSSDIERALVAMASSWHLSSS
jgi:8-amino-7-oxononanoate synthase